MLVDNEERAMLEHFDYYHSEEQDPVYFHSEEEE